MNRKTRMMRETEVRLGEPLEKLIPRTYDLLGSLEAVGAKLDIKPNTLYVWCLRLGLTRTVTLSKPGGNGD